MPGIRTAPAVSGTPALKLVTLFLIDASGDLYAESFYTPGATLAATIETWAVDYQAATQASLYKIGVQDVYNGDADPDNALTLQRNSVKQGINLLMKNPTTLDTFTPRIVAPIPAILQGNQDIPLLSAAELTNVILTLLALSPGHQFQSGQYTERRERSNNPRVK